VTLAKAQYLRLPCLTDRSLIECARQVLAASAYRKYERKIRHAGQNPGTLEGATERH
jgi:hypothetical protein